MKKILSLILALLIIMPTTSFAQNEIRIIVDGKEISSDQPPLIKNDRVFVPVRVIAESLGATVDFENLGGSKRVHISNDKHTSEFVIDCAFCLIDNLELAMDTMPFIENSRTLLPVRVVSQALGCLVLWDDNSRTVNIEKTEYDESKYKDLKTYADKPLVYEAFHEEVPYYYSPHHMSYSIYSVPAINIKGKKAKAVSYEIDKLCQEYFDKNDSEGISYAYSIYDEILSVILRLSVGGIEEYKVFNYDIKGEKLLTNEEIFGRFEIDKEEFKNRILTDYSFNLSNPIFIDNNGFIRAVVKTYEDNGGEFTVDSGINVE